MSMKARLAILTLLSLTLGPTALHSLPAGGQATGDSAPCLPPGIAPDFLSWPVLDRRLLAIPTDAGGAIKGVLLLYGRGNREILTVWLGSGPDLLVVDPRPRTPGPVWLNAALLHEDSGRLRADADLRCRWRRSRALEA